MKKNAHILRFELSPLAKAGVFIRNMKGRDTEGQHDVSSPHRDDHFLLMVATHGRFRLNLDFEEVAVDAPAMLFVFPGQVHHVIEMSDPQGWAVSFDASLVDEEFQLLLEKGLKGPLLLDEHSAFYQQLVTLTDLIEQLQSGEQDHYTSRSVHGLLAAMLNLVSGKITVSSDPKTKESRGTVIEQAFRQLLKQHYKTWKQPSVYAAELAISTAHLNDTVKGITGIPVSVHIQQQAILEAKRLLYFTDLSVKEIGYELGYDEPVYFGKLFRKVTGVTPLQFRQQFRD